METNIISELTTFIEHAPTAFHAVAELKEILKQEGFEELKESEKWEIKPGKRYYVTRNNSSIIAVKAGKELDSYSFHVTASHSDSPAFKTERECGDRGRKEIYGTEYGRIWRNDLFDMVRQTTVTGRKSHGEEWGKNRDQTCEGGQRPSDDPESCNSYGPESE